NLKNSGAEILVDFTNPQAALKNAKIAAESGVGLVIGTTGLKKEELEVIERSVEEKHISAVISPNMATGVNVFFKLVKDTALSLGEGYDVEIVEVHHRHKKDAPSGTALRAGEVIAKALGRDLEKDGVFGRKGMVGKRKTEEIGVHAVRAGDVVGDHTVLFAGEGERIEVIHRAHSRQAFVNGVIKAIRFLAGRAGDGKIYSTWDVLGIR
ncbi:MAG: 4-hydroxy-tetrahydrodipicolinate reductase, partial [Candidatus Hydrothermarchaeales archaeon]